ncbi:hypothetical protein LP419_25570 [Massilia sp. H-1]|nr:hypothetical protein LP419_25570 [Massilia sp. H-1]
MAMQSFAELVAKGQLGSNLFVKQLFGLINLQIRRLSQGEGSLPEMMMRDALFFIAAAPQPSPTAQALRAAYRVNGVVLRPTTKRNATAASTRTRSRPPRMPWPRPASPGTSSRPKSIRRWKPNSRSWSRPSSAPARSSVRPR